VPGPDETRFVGEYLAEQPIARAGIAVDAGLHAEGAENVLVAGAALPGAVPWQEGSGEGIALASGYRAAQAVLEQSATEAATA
jgi:anaerobic glycerol-3-phosphate dehydrogenase